MTDSKNPNLVALANTNAVQKSGSRNLSGVDGATSKPTGPSQASRERAALCGVRHLAGKDAMASQSSICAMHKTNFRLRNVCSSVKDELINMDTLLESGKYSDISLRCQDRTWQVHRAVLCTRSSVFAAMADGNFKEARDREIVLPDDDPRIVDKMLRFLYQGDYDDERGMDSDGGEESTPADPDDMAETGLNPFSPWRDYRTTYPDEYFPKAPSPHWAEEALLINVQVYILADKNDITALKSCARRKYAEVVAPLWNSASFPASAKLLYDNTPDSDRLMRDVIAETAEKNIQTLIDKKEFVEVMTCHGDLAVDVLKSVLLKGGDCEPDLKRTAEAADYPWGIGKQKGKKKSARYG